MVSIKEILDSVEELMQEINSLFETSGFFRKGQEK